MKTTQTNQLLVRYLGHVVVFYEKVKETEKSVWLQRIGNETKPSESNSEHGWEVVPNVNVKDGEVFRKLKTPSGRVKMGTHDFLREYDESTRYIETNF